MADKLIYIPDVNTQSYPFCRLKLTVETFGHSTEINIYFKVSKVGKLTNKKTYIIIKLWGLV